MCFCLFDTESRLLQTLTPHQVSLEDALLTQSFLVEGDRLLQRDRSESGPHVRESDTVILTGLVPMTDASKLALALAQHGSELEDRTETSRRAGSARIAAIDGADSVFDLGPELDIAQSMLRDRVRAYGEPLDVLMLQTLIAFARRQSPALPVLVTAFRIAAFDRTFHSSTHPSSPPAKGELATLYAAFISAADAQEAVDARQNAIAIRQAAAYVALAETLL